MSTGNNLAELQAKLRFENEKMKAARDEEWRANDVSMKLYEQIVATKQRLIKEAISACEWNLEARLESHTKLDVIKYVLTSDACHDLCDKSWLKPYNGAHEAVINGKYELIVHELGSVIKVTAPTDYGMSLDLLIKLAQDCKLKVNPESIQRCKREAIDTFDQLLLARGSE